MAVSSPLLEASIDGAHGVLLSIAGGSDLGLFEINEAAALVSQAAHAEANIIFGAVIDDALGDEVRVTVIAAGFDGGTPVQRPGERAVGQMAGRAPVANERAAAAPAPASAPAATTGYRPYGGQQYAPAGPAQQRVEPAPVEQPVATPPAPVDLPSDEQVLVVPDALEPARARSSRFDESSDDLDVPDFLK
jgi:cell division protein FtsZ